MALRVLLKVTVLAFAAFTSLITAVKSEQVQPRAVELGLSFQPVSYFSSGYSSSGGPSRNTMADWQSDIMNFTAFEACQAIRISTSYGLDDQQNAQTLRTRLSDLQEQLDVTKEMLETSRAATRAWKTKAIKGKRESSELAPLEKRIPMPMPGRPMVKPKRIEMDLDWSRGLSFRF